MQSSALDHEGWNQQRARPCYPHHGSCTRICPLIHKYTIFPPIHNFSLPCHFSLSQALVPSRGCPSSLLRAAARQRRRQRLTMQQLVR